MTSFAHLSLHTEYSIVDSVIRIDQLAEACKARNISAVAITDLTNLSGSWQFQKKLRAHGIKPLFGLDIRVLDEGDSQDRLVLLAQNFDGLLNLFKLMTCAYTDYKVHRCVTMEQLAEFSKNLIALSGGTQGKIGRLLAKGDVSSAKRVVEELKTLFKNRFYLEVTRTGRGHENTYISHAVELSQEFQQPLVATNDVRFINQSDYRAHETRYCVANKQTIGNGEHEKRFSDQQYLRSATEMSELFTDLPDAIENTHQLAKRCTVEIRSRPLLPQFQTDRDGTPEEIIEKVAHDRLNSVLTNSELSHERVKYLKRLRKELDVINEMGFAGYFLIVGDIVSWAKREGIPVGPGRGSGAASLVAYVLGIVDIDPIQYDLMFERLLNPERVSLPDFDIDFCMNRRGEVIDYVTKLYGRASVAQIVSFNTFGSKAAVHDAGRVLGKPRGLSEKMANLIPLVGVQPMPLREAVKEVTELKTMVKNDEEAKLIIDCAIGIEGLARNHGKHAGGVVIAPGALDQYVPIYTDDSERDWVTQLDKNDVEELGLVKFDFLGLKTLTVLAIALEQINARRKREEKDPINLRNLPMDDAKVFQSLHAGETTGIFQLESLGMRQKVKDLNPTELEDLIALLALFRPGPLDTGVTDSYIRRKNKQEKVEYLHPKHEEVLGKTYGLMVYQEDVMNLARELAGFSMGEADRLRAAMGKKNEAVMLELQPKFIEGCVNNDVREDVAVKIYEDMRKFARYAFNRAHTVGYAIVAYQTAFLRYYYPAEFLAALASCETERDAVNSILDEAKRLEITVRQPSVNESQWEFVGNKDMVTVGFAVVRGISRDDANRIIEARSEGPFKSPLDLCKRAKLYRRHHIPLERLVQSGALDCLTPHKDISVKRAEYFAQIDTATKAAQQQAEREEHNVSDLFGTSEEAIDSIPVPTVEPLSLHKLLMDEATALGFYVSGHPIEQYRAELRQLCSHQNVTDIDTLSTDLKRSIGGMVKSARASETRTGKRVVRIQLEDENGNNEISLFDEQARKADLPKAGDIIVVYFSVKNDKHSKEKRVHTSRVAPIAMVRHEHRATVEIDRFADDGHSDFVRELRESLRTRRAKECSVTINCKVNGLTSRVQLGPKWNVSATPELIDDLKNRFGSESVRVSYYEGR